MKYCGEAELFFDPFVPERPMVDWSFLGLSMPAWVLVLAVLLTAAGIRINLRRAA